MGKGKVAIVGGGISGMTAAIYARRAGLNVTVFDLNPSFGRKILKTGGGRCNFANEDTKISHFHGDNKDCIKSVINKFGLNNILEFMEEIGIYPHSLDGWYYPNSMQAKSVRDCFVMEMEILGIKGLTDTKVNGIRADENRFILDTKKGVMDFDGVILATGGMAAPETGSDGNGYMLAKSIGHEVVKVLPALCPLVCEDRHLKEAAGIRVDATITVTIDTKKYSETGNLQITEYGISGICTMQLSGYVAKALSEGKDINVKIDFLPTVKKNELEKILKDRFLNKGRGKSSASALIGLLPDKLISAVLAMAKIAPNFPAVNILPEQILPLSLAIKEYPVFISDVRGFSQAQTTLGGVCFNDIDKNTLLSKINKGLGFCGEILDVYGDCGGYNIMWAISSGAVVGSSILGG